MKNKKPRFLLLAVCFFSCAAFFSGCIRLTGTAGYWHQGKDDEQPQGKSVTLDTNDVVYPNRAKGSIETP